MGLDMYLEARTFVPKINWNESDKVEKMINNVEYNSIIESSKIGDICAKDSVGLSVGVTAIYWRKANAIHGWFVNNVQDGTDDCGEYYVSHDKLRSLYDLVKNAYVNKDPKELMPVSGFFFGSYDIDEWYWDGLKDTLDDLERVINNPNFMDYSFYYSSSW